MDTESMAEEILTFMENAYVPDHHYEVVRLDDYPHVDRKFYEETQRELEGMGFRFLADIEDKTLAAVPGNTLKPTPIRVMLSGDGITMAGIYHPRLKSWWVAMLLFIIRKPLSRTIDFETEFSDATFVCTTNASSGFEISLPPEIDTLYAPPKSTVTYLLEKHHSRLSHKLDQPGIAPVRHSTLDDTTASQARMDTLKSIHRKQVGGITKEEIRKLSLSDSRADEVFDEVQHIKKKGKNPMRKLKTYLNLFWALIVVGFLIYTYKLDSFMGVPDSTDFTIEINKIEQRDENLVILGSIENRGKEDWVSLGIEVEFYDENGTFLDETSGYGGTISLLGSQQRENFKLTEPANVLVIDGYKTAIGKVNRGFKR